MATASNNTSVRNFFLLIEATHVYKEFTARGIDVFWIKGQLLAFQAYTDISRRAVSDIDFFIRPEKTEEAVALLQSLGYVPCPPIKSGTIPSHLVYSYNFEFTHKKDGLRLELHWKLFPDYFCRNLSFEEAWLRRESISLGETQFPVLCLDHNLVYLASHAAKHRWTNMEWLTTLHQLSAKKTTSWQASITDAQRLGCYRRFLLPWRMLQLMGHLLPREIESELKKNPDITSIAEQTLRVLKNKVSPPSQFRYHKAIQDSWVWRCRYLWMFIVRPAFHDVQVSTFSGRWRFLYYLVRPARLIGSRLLRRSS